jgi:hypothetical protein
LSLIDELPGGIKILLTSRLDPDIYEVLTANRHVYTQHMHDVDDAVTRRNMFSYMGDRLDFHEFVHGKRTWSNWRKHSPFAGRTLHASFTWATVTTSLMCELAGMDPDLSEELLNCVQKGVSVRNLCVHFCEMLLQAWGRHRAAFTNEAEETPAETTILVLLNWVYHVEPQLLPGFSRWMTGNGCSGKFVAASPIHLDVSLAESCLQVLEQGLHLNVTECWSSHVANEDRPSAKWISLDHGRLAYACLFWVDHLTDAHEAERLGGQLERFLYTKLLFWLEVMSVVGKIEEAVAMLSKCLNSAFFEVRNDGLSHCEVSQILPLGPSHFVGDATLHSRRCPVCC